MTPFRIRWDYEKVCSGLTNAEEDFLRAAMREAANTWLRVVKGWNGEFPHEALHVSFQLLPEDRPLKIYGRVQADMLSTLSETAGRLAGLPCKGVILINRCAILTLEKGGELRDAVKHEFGHVLGFGTVWQAKDLVAGTTEAPVFTGTAARRVYLELRQKLDPLARLEDVPLEKLCDHWLEAIFGDELMTPNLQTEGVRRLSRLTAAAMEDLGYVVDYSGCDNNYHLPAPGTATGKGDTHFEACLPAGTAAAGPDRCALGRPVFTLP